MDRMKLAKYKRYALIARRNALNPPGLWEMFAIVNGKLVKVDPSRADFRSSPFIEITQEMPIEEARRQFAYSDWLISKAEEISGAAAFRREYLGEWATAAQPSQSTDPTAPAAHTPPAAPPEIA